ncbi:MULTISPECIES: DUF421 domain-containing protein [Bacillaceae]|uniref:DUF421 domain-containing protein n=1 Tax=Bacillus mesophilum TaxID=1071718 RepID=A0A7V7RII8_9BACI|nr:MULTISPECIES: DUF421 domain-containing protein [Bacillaceae]KAB2329860.1 DUF421 domain-containing protein [Bacillus mesophilum]
MNEAAVVAVRSIIAFGSLLIFARFLGKQQVSQITFFDYILGITIGSIAANLTTDLTSEAWPHWIGLITWTFMVFILQVVTLKWRKASVYLDGEPAIVIMNGKIMDGVMKKLRYRISDLQEQLREKGVFNLEEVEYAIIEKDGQISVMKKAEYMPLTAEAVHLKPRYKGLGTELIYDGVIIENNLQAVNHSKKWLEEKVKEHGYKDASEIFLAILDPSGAFFIDGYRDHFQHFTDISDYEGLQ